MLDFASISRYGILLLIATVYLLLQVAYGRRSQIDAWCLARPKLAGAIKLLRAVFPDPWLLVQGMTLIVKGRLPLGYAKAAEMIVKLLAAGACVLLLLGCSGSKPNVSQPQTAVVQTDAGEKLCEFVNMRVDNRDAQVGVCADNDEDLQLAIAALKVAVPIAREVLRK